MPIKQLDPRMIDPSKPLQITSTVITNLTSTSVAANSLSARTFALVHDPANDGIDPIFDIGETLTGSFSGFRIRYEEPTNRLIGSSRTGTTILTSFMINTATGQVGISGLPVAGQALTVVGNVSASGVGAFASLSSNSITLSSVTFTNRFTVATTLTATTTVLEVLINGTSKYLPLFDIN